jgi:hypothetical protein
MEGRQAVHPTLSRFVPRQYFPSMIAIMTQSHQYPTFIFSIIPLCLNNIASCIIISNLTNKGGNAAGIGLAAYSLEA